MNYLREEVAADTFNAIDGNETESESESES